MTTLSSLRARKQQLLDRLRDDSGANQRAEVERLLAHVAAALDLLEEPAKQSRTPLFNHSGNSESRRPQAGHDSLDRSLATNTDDSLRKWSVEGLTHSPKFTDTTEQHRRFCDD
jgi:hypothetical protein